MSAQKKAPRGDGLLPKDLAASWTKIAYGLGAVGVVSLMLGYVLAPTPGRFGAAYLVGFMFTTTIGVGALFMTIIQHLTKAGWSVAPRRLLEWLAQGLVASVALFVPLFILSHDVWHHWMGEHAAHDKIIQGKAAYLNPTFFYVRAIVYLLTWALLATWFYKQSREQDTTGDRRAGDVRDGDHDQLRGLRLADEPRPALVLDDLRRLHLRRRAHLGDGGAVADDRPPAPRGRGR